MVYVIQRSWEQQLVAAMYSALEWIEQHSTVCGKTKTPKKIPKTGKSQKWTSHPIDTWQNPHPKNYEAAKKRTRSTKGRSRECDASTWKFALLLADAKSSETIENERTDIPRTGCPASSSSRRGVTRSCSDTPSGPRVHLPRPHQEL
jgi:hypothetical protein